MLLSLRFVSFGLLIWVFMVHVSVVTISLLVKFFLFFSINKMLDFSILHEKRKVILGYALDYRALNQRFEGLFCVFNFQLPT